MSKSKLKSKVRPQTRLKKPVQEPVEHIHKWRWPKSGGRECVKCFEFE